MPINTRMISCDIKGCKETLIEKEFGLGFPDWAIFKGIILNGTPEPALCPLHKTIVADFIDEIEVIKS